MAGRRPFKDRFVGRPQKRWKVGLENKAVAYTRNKTKAKILS
jgi:hypothetical protein